MLFFECSAKTADGINKFFLETAKKVMKKINNGTIDPTNDVHGVKLGTSHNNNSLNN